MSDFFTDYVAAHTHAVDLANRLGKEVGIEIGHDLTGKAGFRVMSLPRKESRYGHELRCELVAPGDRKTPSGAT